MENKLIELIKKSNSLEILREINKKIPERNFHEYTHILYDLRELLGSSKKTYLEIGSYVGSSASLLLQHKYKTDIICIDPLNLNKNHYNGKLNQEETLNKNLNNNNINNNNIKIYKKFSNDKILLDKLKNIKVDILFIDGCHKFKSVIDDFNNYKNKVNKGGFIVFDDYLDYKYSPEVRKAVDYIVKNIDISEYIIIGSIKDFKNINLTKRKYSNEFILYKKI